MSSGSSSSADSFPLVLRLLLDLIGCAGLEALESSVFELGETKDLRFLRLDMVVQGVTGLIGVKQLE